jgi:signal transduction histidine kinase
MILVQGGRAATGTELDGRPVGPRGRRMLSDRRASAARRRRRRAERVAQGASRPPLDEVTAGLAHDLNNRLSVILGQAQLLRRGTVDGAAGARRLEKIEEETMRASRMTRGLLDLARREAPAHVPVAINTLVPRALAIAHGKLRGTRIEVTTRLTAAAPLVRGDAAQLTQVLVHLIDNAIEAMGETGQLTITTAITDDGLEVAVTDTGAGMLPEEVNRIFEPFYTTKPDGEGLGLFHTLTVLKAHGGSVAVDSAPGCGTTMCVRLAQALSVAGAPRIDRA